TTKRPKPGILKTVSVTTTPPINMAMLTPIMVTIGTAAVFKAWRNNTPRSDRLFALAVLMQASFITSIMLVRTILDISAIYTVLRDRVGKTIRCKNGQTPSLGGLYPWTGNNPNFMERK